ncbi:MAG: family 16 glycoside hydrolase [Verrucomicrobiales bacterium]
MTRFNLFCTLFTTLLTAVACSGKRHLPANGNTPPTEWRELFDGKSLAGWQRLGFDDSGGRIEVREGKLLFTRGDPLTAMVISDRSFTPPAREYEIIVRARKMDGRDFFCALTFPVPEKSACCTFVAGGWGGGVTGLSNIDHLDANRNTTRSVVHYETGQWYDLRIEIRSGRIRCWVDERIVVNSLIADKIVSMRPGAIEQCQPLGIASFATSAQFESLRLRALPPEN